MNNKVNEISSGQVYIFVISAQISSGIITLPSSLAEKLGHDGWISILLSGLITCILISIMMSLLKRSGNLSIMEINTYFFGKFIGTFLNLLLISYITFLVAMSLRIFIENVNISVLQSTPELVLTCFIFLPIAYLSWYGLKYICWFSYIKPLLLIIILLYFILISNLFRATFLQPIGISGIKNIIKGSYEPFLSFLGFELITLIYPYIKDKNNSLKFLIYGNLTTTFFYIITTVILIGFFGENMLKQLNHPLFSIARAYKAPVLERLDLFFISLWFPIMAISILTYFFCAFSSMKKLLKLENDKPKSKILLIVFSIFVISLSRLPKDILQVRKLFDIVGYLGATYICYILLCYIISFIKKPRGVENEKPL